MFSWSDWANAFGARISQKSCSVFFSLPYTEGCVISVRVIAGDLLLLAAGQLWPLKPSWWPGCVHGPGRLWRKTFTITEFPSSPEQSGKCHILQPSGNFKRPELPQWVRVQKGAGIMVERGQCSAKMLLIGCDSGVFYQKGCQLFFQRLHQEPGCQS